MRFTFIVALITWIVALGFVLLNPDEAVLYLGSYEIRGYASAVFLVILGFGLIVAVLATKKWRQKKRKEIKPLYEVLREALQEKPSSTESANQT